jgi:hypothetical protein
MTSFAELLASVREDLVHRYRSPLVVPLVLSTLVEHWRVVAFIASESHKSHELIAFIEANASWQSLTWSLSLALAYILAFPWVEFAVARVAAFGRRKRYEFQAEEQEREQARRKVIAQRQAQLLALELQNTTDQSKLADVELVKSFQTILSSESFARWMNDLESGVVNYQFGNSIVNYLMRVDTVEGKFINEAVEKAHANFVSLLSTVHSAIDDVRANKDKVPTEEIKVFASKAIEAQRHYRSTVRRELGV